MSLFQILPNDILKLIQEHLSASIIQYIYLKYTDLLRY